MELFTSAVLAAIANQSNVLVGDCYQAIKSLLKRKFGEQSDIVTATEKLEVDKTSEAWKAVLNEEANRLEASKDSELNEATQKLTDALEQAGIQINVSISDQATAQGVIGGGNVEIGEMSFSTPKKG